MLWHILAPTSDGGHNSLDYREDLTEALNASRHWRWSTSEDVAIAKGVNGAPLRWVFYDRREGEAKHAVSVHATILGAKRAYRKYGRNHTNWVHGDPGKPIAEWGFEEVNHW